MDSDIRCNNCDRIMNFWEFIGEAEVYILTTLGAPLLAVTLKTLTDLLTKKKPTVQTRGLVDNQMGFFANHFKTKCPDCGDCHWQAASSKKTSKVFLSKNRKKKIGITT